MASPAALDDFRIRVYCTLGPQTSINVFHFRVTSTILAPTDQDFADAVSAVVAPLWKAILVDDATYYGVDVWRYRIAAPPTPVFSRVSTGVGDNAGDPLPSQVAGILSHRTPFSGRSFHGRTYLPFPSEGDSDINVGIVVPIAGYVTRAAAIATLITSNPRFGVVGTPSVIGSFGIYSRKLAVFNAIVVSTAKRLWANQHPRGDFGRPNAPPF